MININRLLQYLFMAALVVVAYSCGDDDSDDTETTIVFDCPDIEADIGDTCTLASGFGIINEGKNFF